MEELIPLFLFVIFSILTAVGKARKNKKKSPKAQRRKGLTARFIGWLFDLQKRIEDQSKEVPRRVFDWGELLGRSKSQRPHTTPHDEVRQGIDPDPFEEPPSPLPKTAPAGMSPSPYEPMQPLGKLNKEAVDIPRVKMKARRSPMPLALPSNRTDLRQAIVWSEIIGPPIALRDPFGDHR